MSTKEKLVTIGCLLLAGYQIGFAVEAMIAFAANGQAPELSTALLYPLGGLVLAAVGIRNTPLALVGRD